MYVSDSQLGAILPPGTFPMSGELQMLTTGCGRGAAAIEWVEARGALDAPTTKNNGVQIVSDVEVGKSCHRLWQGLIQSTQILLGTY